MKPKTNNPLEAAYCALHNAKSATNRYEAMDFVTECLNHLDNCNYSDSYLVRTSILVEVKNQWDM